jgi:hypothetical protein
MTRARDLANITYETTPQLETLTIERKSKW